MADKIKVGLLGYGYASKTFHAPLIMGTPGLELAGVSSSDASKVHADWPAIPVVVTNGAIVIHTQRLKSDPGG
ncbi:hypothetical protein PSW63_01720, partial [Yersinia pestis]|nr:hypothetical protein [Yersinia pestis]